MVGGERRDDGKIGELKKQKKRMADGMEDEELIDLLSVFSSEDQ